MERDLLIEKPLEQVVMHYAQTARAAGLDGVVCSPPGRPDEPFTWASGIKSPIYCDNRLTLTDVEVRTDVEQGLASLIREHYPEVEVLMGTSSGPPPAPVSDGGHNHPTQTLTDLLTIHREKGRFDDLTIGLCGDLKFGRTVHSLVAAMSRYTGIRFVLISPEELKLPRYVKEQYVKSKNIPYIQSTSLDEVMPELDILYMTRVQRERFFNEEDYLRLKDSYILTPEKLKNLWSDIPSPTMSQATPAHHSRTVYPGDLPGAVPELGRDPGCALWRSG